MVFASVAEFGAVETKDCDGKNELQKAQGQVGDDQWQGLAAGDSGGCFLVEPRECHHEGVLVCNAKMSVCFFFFDWNDWATQCLALRANSHRNGKSSYQGRLLTTLLTT